MEEVFKKDFVKWLMVLGFMFILAIMAIYIGTLKERLDRMERKSEEQMTIQQGQYDSLSLNIESVRNEMNLGFEEQQKQIDSQAEQIERQKRISSATNKAFTRFQKQAEQTETELREELKKD